jgi:hypothetical protein
MTFDRNNDKIAITVPSFTFKRGASSILFEDITDLIYSEPYLVTVAIDGNGVNQNALNFNFAEYLNVRRGGTVNMIGNGHLVYGPGNPGDYVAISVLLMESNRDARAKGEEIEDIVKSKAEETHIVQEIAKSIAELAGGNKLGVPLKLMQGLLGHVATHLQASKDKYLFRTEGIFFKNTRVPYDVNRQFVSGNEFADLTIQVIPLDEPNGQGPTTARVALTP